MAEDQKSQSEGSDEKPDADAVDVTTKAPEPPAESKVADDASEIKGTEQTTDGPPSPGTQLGPDAGDGIISSAGRPDVGVISVAFTQAATQPVYDEYVVLVTLLGNNYEYGMTVTREQLIESGIDIGTRVQAGALVRVMDGDPRAETAVAARAMADAAQGRLLRDMGVVNNG